MLTAAIISGCYFAIAAIVWKVIGQSSKNDNPLARFERDEFDENSYS